MKLHVDRQSYFSECGEGEEGTENPETVDECVARLMTEFRVPRISSTHASIGVPYYFWFMTVYLCTLVYC